FLWRFLGQHTNAAFFLEGIAVAINRRTIPIPNTAYVSLYPSIRHQIPGTQRPGESHKTARKLVSALLACVVLPKLALVRIVDVRTNICGINATCSGPGISWNQLRDRLKV